MAGTALPIEVLDRVVQFARHQELLTLSRVSRELQPIAEAKLYEEVIIREHMQAGKGCTALSQQNYARAPYVRRFWLFQDPRLCQRGPWPEQFWRRIQAILERMTSLENLYIYDDTSANTWIFDRPMPFRLRDVCLHFHWDDRLVAFLETQDQLRRLAVQTSIEDGGIINHRGPQLGSLPSLEVLEAPLHVAFDLIACKIQKMAIVIDDESAPLFATFVEVFAKTNKTIRSLNLVAIPEFLVADCLQVLGASTLATTLRHLGVLSLPLMDRNDIHRSLLNFSRLEILQVDVSHWMNAPVPPSMQRVVATELRTYCPTIKQFVFWHGTNQAIWRFDMEQWVPQQLPGPRYVTRDLLWREF